MTIMRKRMPAAAIISSARNASCRVLIHLIHHFVAGPKACHCGRGPRISCALCVCEDLGSAWVAAGRRRHAVGPPRWDLLWVAVEGHERALMPGLGRPGLPAGPGDSLGVEG